MIVELDPAADSQRVRAHADRLPALLRAAFGPLVLRTAPPASAFRELAEAAGFVQQACTDDPVQPVYIMELA